MAAARLAIRRSAQQSLSHLAPSFRFAAFRSSSSTRLVSDRIVHLTAVDVDGHRRPFLGLTNRTLLSALKDKRIIDPECHRIEDVYACSGECRVSVATEWLDKLPPRSEEEMDVLVLASDKGHVDLHDRLGCQILLAPALEGMVVAVPEQKPWDIA